MVAPANAGPMFFVKPARSPIQTIADFTGKRIVIGTKGSGMEQHVHTIFGALGIAFDSFSPIHMGFDEGACVDRRRYRRSIPAADSEPGHDGSEPAGRRSSRPIRARPAGEGLRRCPVLSRGDDAERRVPRCRGRYRSTAVINVLVTHERISENIAHDMAKAIVSNLDTLPAMNPLFKGLKDLFEPLRAKGAAAFEFGGVPLHLGALRAYREAGWLS